MTSNRTNPPGGGRVEEARKFLADTHYCDYGSTWEKYGYTHPHQGCECPCSVCFSFWHWNIWRYEEARKLVREAEQSDDPEVRS